MTEGDRMTWLYTPRGGYGYTIPVDAEIVKRLPSGRVQIRVSLRTGETVLRTVKPESLKTKDE